MNILGFIFLIPAQSSIKPGRKKLLLLCCMLAATLPVAQAETQPDTLFVPSLRIGLDVSGFARQIVEAETLPLEVSADFEWRENIFAAAEGGWLNVDVDRDTHRYRARGYFIRTGADLNILRGSEHNPNDVIIISLRYGYGKLEQEAPHIVIQDPYWGDFITTAEKESYAAHWLEAGLGMKAEIWNNLFLGWSLRGRLRISRTSDPNMEPYFISGFGKSGNTALMFHYSIFYRIPFH